MYLIRQLAKKYNLTRTALLHYDAIGLLSPATRTEAGYRLYSEEDEQRLQNILLFRSMGLSLESIRQLLENDKSKLANILLVQLDKLNQEIEELRNQQRNIINLFKEIKTLEEFMSYVSYDELEQILLDGIQPVEWHQKFETISPDLHKQFLEIIDFAPESIRDLVQALRNSLPEEGQNRLNGILHKK